MVRRNPPRKVTYFEPAPPRLARNTIIEFDLRGRPPLPLHDARRLRPARHRCGHPAGTRRMAPAHAGAPRRRGACGLARGPQCGLSVGRPDNWRAPASRRVRGGSAGSVFGPIRSSRYDDDKASGEPPSGSFFRPMPERARAEVHPCEHGSLESRRRRAAGCARGAAPPCGHGSSENRQRRGVGSCFLRFLVILCDYPAAATGSISDGSLFRTLPTRALTGQHIMPSAG